MRTDGQTDRQTDRHDEANGRFSNFAKVPEKKKGKKEPAYSVCYFRDLYIRPPVTRRSAVWEMPVKNLPSVSNKVQFRWPRGLRRGYAASRLLGLRVWFPLVSWIKCCVFSDRLLLRQADLSSRVVLPCVCVCVCVRAGAPAWECVCIMDCQQVQQ